MPTQTIDSESTILEVQPSQTVGSSTIVSLKFLDLIGNVVAERVGAVDEEGNIEPEQTTPTAPTLLTATDLKLGDSVRLVWSGGGPFYNVYYKIAASIDPFTLANANPLSGSSTQYDVGGLTTGTLYTFMLRGVNGIGTESADSNTLTATPTFDLTQSKFTKPTWEVKVNSVTNTEAILASVELGYGNDLSRGIFEIRKDPDGGGFPVYNDIVEIFINSRRVLKGKIKGITKIISRSGIGKSFTVISNITQLQESVVPTDKSIWNEKEEEEDTEANKSPANEILSSILGYTPSGTPEEFPGTLHLTDQTLLDATESVIRKLGNYKLYFNQVTEQLEVYQFGQGGDVTRQFTKGKNILEFNVTENRQDVVDEVTVIGPPSLLRVRKIIAIQDTDLEPDDSGKLTISFLRSEPNIRDVFVEGSQRPEPVIEYKPDIQVTPEEMGLEGLGDEPATWPFFPLSQKEGNIQGDRRLKYAIKAINVQPSGFSSVGSSVRYESEDQTRVFVGDVPKIWETETISAFVERSKLGIAGGGTISVQVLTRLSWFPGALRVSYTYEDGRPTATVGSGTVKRTITDNQYQIFVNSIPGQLFTNETEVLDIVQERAQNEYARLNRSRTGGTITVIGDETIDLKSTILVDGQKLDVARVVHNVSNGFTTQVTLTNEIFIPNIIEEIPTPDNGRESERRAQTTFRLGQEDAKVDQNIATQRRQEFQRNNTPPEAPGAVYL